METKTEIQQIHYLDFPSDIQKVVKLEDSSIAICLGIDLFLCSPFTQNRPLGGMHNKNFKNSHPIMGVCSMPISSELTYRFFKSITNYCHPFKIQTGIVLFDTDNNFTVIDCPRNLVITKFKFENSYDVVDICSHPDTPCQLAILTASELLIIQIDLNQYTLLRVIPIEGKSISPFLDGFLIDTHHSLRFVAKDSSQVKQYAPHDPFADFRVDHNRVVIVTPSSSGKVRIKVIGGGSYQISVFCEELIWDVAGGLIFVLNDATHITISSIEDVSKNCSLTLKEKLPKTLDMFAGVDRYQKNVVIILFSSRNATTVSVPINLFDS